MSVLSADWSSSLNVRANHEGLRRIDMIKDGWDYRNQVVECEICIVGAGAAGIAIANKLMANNVKGVVVLESGSQEILKPPGNEFRYLDPLAEQMDYGSVGNSSMPNDRSFVQEARPRYMQESRTRCFGGSTNCWGGWIRPLDTYDFGNDWPIKRDALDKPVPRTGKSYFSEALSLVDLEHFDIFDKPQEWKPLVVQYKKVDVLPEDKLNQCGLKTVVIQQQSDLSKANFSVRYNDLFKTADASKLLLIKNATALTMAYDQSGKVVQSLRVGSLACAQGVIYFGSHFSVKAKKYILAMGGLEIPRFLMMNGIDQKLPDIGKYYMNHPKYVTCARAKITGIDSVISNEVTHFYNGVTSIKGPTDGPTTGAVQAFVVPTEQWLNDKTKNIRNFRTALVWEGYDEGRKAWNLRVELNFEQVPNRDSHVRLVGGTSSLEQRMLHLDWKFTETDQLTVQNSMQMIKNFLIKLAGDKKENVEFEALEWSFKDHPDIPARDVDYAKVPSPDHFVYSGDHHIGTTKMGSVVDKDCKLNGFDNVWISSTGVYPTGGWANATLTLLALAIRLADHITP